MRTSLIVPWSLALMFGATTVLLSIWMWWPMTHPEQVQWVRTDYQTYDKDWRSHLTTDAAPTPTEAPVK